MTATWILGTIAAVLTMASSGMLMGKVWWAPHFRLGVQVVWIAYGLTNPAAYPILLISLWYIGRCLWAMPKWRRER